jgi:hypothetical protein
LKTGPEREEGVVWVIVSIIQENVPVVKKQERNATDLAEILDFK